jgi:hypothetical protein
MDERCTAARAWDLSTAGLMLPVRCSEESNRRQPIAPEGRAGKQTRPPLDLTIPMIGLCIEFVRNRPLPGGHFDSWQRTHG